MHPTRHIRPRLAAIGIGLAFGVGALTGCGSDGSGAVDPESSSTTGDAPTTTDPASTSPAPTETTPSGTGATVTVPVYLVGDTPQGPRLYREFHQVSAADPVTGAAHELTTGTALDPDYRSLLTGIEITGVTAAPDGIVVTVDSGSFAVPMTRGQRRVGVQSLVYTVQGAAQTRAPVFVRTTDGTPISLLGVDTSAGLTRAGELKVLALVNVTDPAQGSTVSGSFTANGVASSFEGTVPWQVLDASGTSVAEGSAQAEGFIDGLYPWSAEVDVSGLAPGAYTFVARTDDPSEVEGGGPTEDTKTITVQ